MMAIYDLFNAFVFLVHFYKIVIFYTISWIMYCFMKKIEEQKMVANCLCLAFVQSVSENAYISFKMQFCIFSPSYNTTQSTLQLNLPF